jgi:MFS family permease
LREADHSHADAKPPRFALPTAAILVLVVVTLPAMVLEGAGFDWSAIYMRDVFGTTAFWGGVAVATGAAAQALTRYFADGFVERHSPVVVTRILVSVLAVGDVLVFVSPAPWLSLLGFALMGVGSSAIFPLAMSAAAQRTDRPSTVNVASLAQTAFVAFLLAPPLLGYVAQSFGIRWSFGIALPLVVASMWLSRAMGASAVRRS